LSSAGNRERDVTMATLIKGQTYPFSGKYNNLMLKLVSTNHPQSGEVNFFGSWMPNKPVFYALTESAYLESNYRIAMGPKLKDYTNFMYLPVESIIEVLLNEDDVVLFTINSTIVDVYLHGATEKQESVIQPTSVLAEDFEDLCRFLHAAQKTKGVELAEIKEISGDSVQEVSLGIEEMTSALLKAKQLLDSGVISQEEFDEMKKSLLKN